ncbi:MAG: hypothetical protein GTN84_04710 [Hydrogenophaga sp.]|uniref:hypothetical protein n=1 Tax=Hydrogenophaga sp. TaxID=1904254 RepID=UPI0016B3AB3C|nr:hypothetical protein [Hydrogenophaga sp.]NIM42680.1 hypothetical protein [Hydrogenophaga sp.]NIN25723.1 hypothetical protein [Hydrogenophaga sp.]NIN30385.1 hypothetical protein [Hydrogenophaga sp.]NIN56725.1 hypothetical protein [Hydrogenophaga sp.]NIO53300.1 hypothetical protein [Hydrogenophaga sp.]
MIPWYPALPAAVVSGPLASACSILMLAARALCDAAAVTVLAACVDLQWVPPRLTPGFERRLRRGSLTGVYLASGAGLALAGLLSARDPRA